MDDPLAYKILQPLLSRLREENSQARINEVLQALATAAAYVVVGTDVPDSAQGFFQAAFDCEVERIKEATQRLDS